MTPRAHACIGAGDVLSNHTRIRLSPSLLSWEVGPHGPTLLVAVKSLKPEVLSDLEDLRRFLLEVGTEGEEGECFQTSSSETDPNEYFK